MQVPGFLLKMNKKQWFFVFLITLLAFAIRGHLMRYELFFEFDSYLHARIVGYILQTGAVPSVDPLAYYFMEVGMPITYAFWYFSAFMYKILFLGAGYAKDNVILLVKFLPAFFGALTAGAMFFLGKEIYNKKAGYAMAFVAAVSPAFIYRTMSGFFEDDCLGFLWFVLGLIFFVRALKSESIDRKMIMNTVLAGLFFAAMAWSWGMFILVPLILGPYFILALLKIAWQKKNAKEIAAFIAPFAGTLAIFQIFMLPYVLFNSSPLYWLERSLGYIDQAFVGTAMLWVPAMIVLFALITVLALRLKPEQKEKLAKIPPLIIMILLFVSLLITASLFLTVDRVFAAEGVLGASVGEENTGHQFFFSKYNVLMILPVLALFLIPIRVWRNPKDHFSIILFLWILITLVMAWYKLKFTFVFGLSLAPAAGIVAAELFYYLRNKTKLESKILLACFAFLMLTGLAAGITFTKTNIPNIEFTTPNWKPALDWMKNETPENAKMFNWWDEGHWITFLGERAVLNDNRNMSKESDQDFALFTVTSDLNTALRMFDPDNPTPAGIAKGYDSDYVVLSTDFFYKMVSMSQYAYDTTNYDDPRIVPFRYGVSYSFGCSMTEKGEVICGQNVFQPSQWSFMPVKWQEMPSDFYQERIPLWFYKDTDVPIWYILNEATNQSMLARLWFNEPETMKYFEQVYAKEGIKIFKIKKEAILEALG